MEATDKEGEGFGYLRQKFPKISEAKTKKEFSWVHKLHNYSKTKTSAKKKKIINSTQRRPEDLKMSAETF